MFMRDGALQIVEAAGWRVALGPSEHGFQQLSFVNSSFWTRTGGTHVSTVVAEIASKALQRHHKRLKDPAEVMQAPGRFTSGYVVIVDVAIEQPQFNFILRDSLLMPKLPGSFRLSDSTLEFLESHQALKAYREMARKREQKKAGDAVRAGEAVVVPRL
jgi:DNA gyrase/topoisomerase IV subunit B